MYGYETERRAVCTRSLHTHHMLSLCSLRSHQTTAPTRMPRCSLALRCPPRLLCSLRSPLASAGLRSRFARPRACRLACLLHSPYRLLASLDPPLPLLAPLVVSPAALPHFARATSPRSARRLACCALASLFSSPAARSARRLDCRSLRSPLAAPPAARFARRLPARSARPSHSPCPLRLLKRLISDGQGGSVDGQYLRN